MCGEFNSNRLKVKRKYIGSCNWKIPGWTWSTAGSKGYYSCYQVCLPPFLPPFLSLSLLVHVPLPRCPTFPGSQLSRDGTMAASNNYLIVYLLINPTRKRDSVFLTGQKSPAIESSWCQLVHNVLFEPCLSHMPTCGHSSTQTTWTKNRGWVFSRGNHGTVIRRHKQKSQMSATIFHSTRSFFWTVFSQEFWLLLNC